MTQPAPPRRGGFLRQPLMGLPLWLWFVIFVLAVVLFLKWRQGKSSSSTSNLTNQPGGLAEGPSTIYVTTGSNGGTTGGTTGGGQPGSNGGGSLSAHQRHVLHLQHEQHVANIGAANGTPTPAPRTSTMTTTAPPQVGDISNATGVAPGVVAAANAGQVGAAAALHGFTGGSTVHPVKRLPIPVGGISAHQAHLIHQRNVAAKATPKIMGAITSLRKAPSTSSQTPTSAAYNQGRTV